MNIPLYLTTVYGQCIHHLLVGKVGGAEKQKSVTKPLSSWKGFEPRLLHKYTNA